MLIKSTPRWALRDAKATPEPVFLNRRQLLQAGAGAFAIGAASALVAGPAHAASQAETDALYPFTRNGAFTVQRPITDEALSSAYNNFYEFGSHKRIAKAAQKLEIRPWEVRIDGLVEEPFTIGIDELIKKMPLEERVYRHRCVEAWSMIVPWSGFTLAALVDMARPLSSAKFVRMETFENPKVAPGQKQFWYPWPYVEGLTMAEATNDLAFMATGVYGKPLAKQFGAPLRLAVPWKYGFKSIKSIVRIEFTETQPVSFWEEIQPKEYGFYANVNPEVPHKRWSQATEQPLGSRDRIPTLLYNGYEAEVAHLYKDGDPKRLFY
ncbi:MAG: protein-methionine-sulfoxide reductase catalytic subunit MsrP [Pseudomonadota bacterium]